MTTWRSIETAPSDFADGDPETLLVWVKGNREKTGHVSFGYVYESRRTGKKNAQAHGHTGDFLITHWMPLPSSPDDL